MCAYLIAWNETHPVGSAVAANTLDTELQNLKKSVRQRMDDILSNDWADDSHQPKTLDPTSMAAGAIANATLAIGSLTGTPICARVWTSVSVTLATGVGRTVAWNQEAIDTSGFHDNSSDNPRLTCAAAGYYRISAQFTLLSGANAATAFTIFIAKNGATGASGVQKIINNHLGSTINATFYIETIQLVAADDYFELWIDQSSGNSWTVVGGEFVSTFMIEKLNGTT
jgi:hypothetical protein